MRTVLAGAALAAFVVTPVLADYYIVQEPSTKRCRIVEERPASPGIGVVVGTSAATLVGLMFVAASIGASVFTEKDRAALKAFISPTVVHFTTVLVIAVVALVPTHEWLTLASLLALVGVAGAIYSASVWIELFIHRRFNVDVVDRLFYAGFPLVGHLLLLLAALFLWRQSEAGLDLLAAGQIKLLLAGIGNAWDMMIWIVIRIPTADPGSRDDT